MVWKLLTMIVTPEACEKASGTESLQVAAYDVMGTSLYSLEALIQSYALQTTLLTLHLH